MTAFPGDAPSRAKILVVDDEPSVRELEVSVLGELGHHVIEAANGQEAVRLAREQQPDLILLDLMMPGLPGINVCRQLRDDQRTSDARIIVVSGADAKQAVEESILAGAADFLGKPLDVLELMVRVRSMLRVRNIQDPDRRLEAYVKNLHSIRKIKKPSVGTIQTERPST